jgi:dihydroneopterin aldolase
MLTQKNMGKITLNGMNFYAFHGCFAEEQAIGTHFRLDVSFVTDTERAQQTDNIADTVSYLDVYQTIRREMEIPSHLLEHVGERVCTALLSVFPAIERVDVRVSKLNPPLGGQLESVTVEVTKARTR